MDDQLLIRRAIEKAGARVQLQFVEDGEEALLYLTGKGKYADRNKYPFPSCIITDLKMPRRSGFDVLEWLTAHPECRVIPVIVLTSSNQPEDIIKAHQLGANSYFVKPAEFNELLDLFKLIVAYWRVASRPPVAGCI